ncbi:YwpF-like family protein [Bacillus pumilus]|uniref:YwpF-like family protein n=1 Tax=Bacillus pumilus TaxID=1408 RepID=UPI0021B20362|nr:YwpF-like family protein [Bacillus pumilus]
MINKEDGENEWMMEGVMGKKDREVFEVVFEEESEVKIVVRMRKEKKGCVDVCVEVKKIVGLEEKICVVLDGKMIRNR